MLSHTSFPTEARVPRPTPHSKADTLSDLRPRVIEFAGQRDFTIRRTRRFSRARDMPHSIKLLTRSGIELCHVRFHQQIKFIQTESSARSIQRLASNVVAPRLRTQHVGIRRLLRFPRIQTEAINESGRDLRTPLLSNRLNRLAPIVLLIASNPREGAPDVPFPPDRRRRAAAA